jgi:hypothetical protein
MYGIISQIPKVIYCATTAHTKIVKTKLASYSFHKISGSFFKGFSWDKNSSFLLALVEKAFVDTLYISSRKGKRFYHFPELEFPSSFSFKKAKQWAELIKEKRIKSFVLERIESLNPKRAR